MQKKSEKANEWLPRKTGQNNVQNIQEHFRFFFATKACRNKLHSNINYAPSF